MYIDVCCILVVLLCAAKRSYLGVMQDDVEEEKELLQKQRAEVAVLREQLKYQVVVITPTGTFVILTFKKF